MNEPKTVIKHTRTITTFYLSDSSAHDLFKKLNGFLADLELPDSYEGGDVVAVTGDDEIDECINLGNDPGHLEDELEECSIPYDTTMEHWNKG